MLSLSSPQTNSVYYSKELNLSPTIYPNACRCGHNIKYRELAYETRRKDNRRYWGVTIRPKIKPTKITLR